MPVFIYKVENSDGAVLTGESNIESKERLIELINKNGYKVIEIVEKNFITDVSQIGLFKKKVKLGDLAQFCRQFSIMLEAGISIAGALDVLRTQTINPTLREVLTEVYNNIQKGLSLSRVLRFYPNIFPNILLSMVEAGEASGQLDRVFVRLADHFEKEHKQRQKIVGAMTYPIIVLVIAIIVVIVMITNVIPTFGKALTGMDVELPMITQIMLKISDTFISYWYVLMLGIMVLIFGIKALSETKKGKRFIDDKVLKLPVVSGVIKTLMTARLTRALTTLISSGVLLIESMEITQKVLGNSVLIEKMETAIESIKQGRGLTQTIAEMKYFPPLVISMIKTGEESGSLDFTLEKAADFYEEQLDVQIQKMTTFIEPVIMIALGGVVAFVIFSVLYPMISVYQNIGTF
jgi:type IV pilus assembly protein PilC